MHFQVPLNTRFSIAAELRAFQDGLSSMELLMKFVLWIFGSRDLGAIFKFMHAE
jgi:hypothetical protein